MRKETEDLIKRINKFPEACTQKGFYFKTPKTTKAHASEIYTGFGLLFIRPRNNNFLYWTIAEKIRIRRAMRLARLKIDHYGY